MQKDFKMDFVKYMKALTRPFITCLLAIGWICMITESIDYPVAYEAATLGSLAWWGVDRSLLHRKERK